MKRPSQHVFTIVDDIVDEQAEQRLRDALKASPFPFDTVPGIHFASIVILPGQADLRSRPKLVLECNIDGAIGPFLQRLESAGIARVFQSCVGFTPDCNVAAYLRRHKRRPHLFHIGTPFRSVTSIRDDARERAHLSKYLNPAMRRVAATTLHRAAPGMSEWWTWEVLKPWAAALAFVSILLQAYLATRVQWHALGRLDAWYVGVVFALAALATLAGSLKLWLTSSPALREAVVEATIALVATALVEAILIRCGVRGVTLVVVAIVGVAAAVWRVREAVGRRRTMQLAEMRTAEGRSAPMEVLPPILAPARESPVFWRRLLAWSPWVLTAILMTAAFHRVMQHVRWVTVGVAALAFLEAVWITTLAGWPARGHWIGWSRKPVAFIIGNAAVAFLVAKFLLLTIPPSGWLAFVLNVAFVAQFFLSWSLMLPTPEPAARRRPSRPALERQLEQEDRGVQNHMAAVVPLPGGALRAWSLRAFLWLLNWFFFRSVLPDLYKGKLFGVPTVHFCQWVLLDNRNYLFLSNYDHSWSAYLDDFGANLATGLQKIWGQGIDMPGFADVELFKQYARFTMFPYAQWYSAYPRLSTRHIWNNEQIRCRLAADGPEEQRVKAMRRFSAAPKSLPGFLHARTR